MLYLILAVVMALLVLVSPWAGVRHERSSGAAMRPRQLAAAFGFGLLVFALGVMLLRSDALLAVFAFFGLVFFVIWATRRQQQ